jgi:hypothetical protein
MTHITINSLIRGPGGCWHMVIFEHTCCCTVWKTDFYFSEHHLGQTRHSRIKKDCQKITSATHGRPPSSVYGKCTALYLSVCRLSHSNTCRNRIIKLSFMSFSIFVWIPLTLSKLVHALMKSLFTVRRTSHEARSPSPTKSSSGGFSVQSPVSPGGSSGFSSRRSSQDGFHLEGNSHIFFPLS